MIKIISNFLFFISYAIINFFLAEISCSCLGLVFLISGERVDFAVEGDEHIPAVALKIFLRDLQEPLLTFDLYQPVLRLHSKYVPTNEHSIVCLYKNR